jgi:hypothetical protein
LAGTAPHQSLSRTLSVYAQAVGSDLKNEGRDLARAVAKEIAALSWEDLDAYVKREQEVVAPSGRRFRLTANVFWDMEPWASGIYIIVRAAPLRGWRRVWPHKAVETRGGRDDLVPEWRRP